MRVTKEVIGEHMGSTPSMLEVNIKCQLTKEVNIKEKNTV